MAILVVDISNGGHKIRTCKKVAIKAMKRKYHSRDIVMDLREVTTFGWYSFFFYRFIVRMMLIFKHWDLELAAQYAKFILRHTWCIKHKSHKHTFFINLFYLRTFSKKKEILFFGSVWLFFC